MTLIGAPDRDAAGMRPLISRRTFVATTAVAGHGRGWVLHRMKPYAHFGDVARVRVTDEAALAEEITGRPNAGAGIDVTTDEPPAAHPPPSVSSMWRPPFIRQARRAGTMTT